MWGFVNNFMTKNEYRHYSSHYSVEFNLRTMTIVTDLITSTKYLLQVGDLAALFQISLKVKNLIIVSKKKQLNNHY